MSDAIGELRDVASAGNVRRRQTRMVVVALLLLMAVNLASVLGVGVMFLHDRERQARERRNLAVGSKIVTDLYSIANDTNAVVHRIEGTPAPAAPQPPLTPTRTTRRPTTATSSTRRPSASAGTTTTQPSSPPASGAPAPSQPPQTTMTTTRPCVTVPLGGSAVCP